MQASSIFLMCWIWHLKTIGIGAVDFPGGCQESTSHDAHPGDNVWLSCPVIEGGTISDVIWYLTLPDQTRIQLDLGGGTFSRGVRLVDLNIMNIMAQFEGHYSCQRMGSLNDSSPVDVACVFVIATAALRCSGGTDCLFGVQTAPGTTACNRSLTATAGSNVSLDTSIVFNGGGLRRQEVKEVSIGRIRCSVLDTNCTNSSVRLAVEEMDSILDIRLVLINVTPDHSGPYPVRVDISDPIRPHYLCHQYDLTVHEAPSPSTPVSTYTETTQTHSDSQDTTTESTNSLTTNPETGTTNLNPTTTTSAHPTADVAGGTSRTASPATSNSATTTTATVALRQVNESLTVKILAGVVGGVLVLLVIIVSGGLVVGLRWTSCYRRHLSSKGDILSSGDDFAFPAQHSIVITEEVITKNNCSSGTCSCGGGGQRSESPPSVRFTDIVTEAPPPRWSTESREPHDTAEHPTSNQDTRRKRRSGSNFDEEDIHLAGDLFSHEAYI